jgi:hypothetical protein
MLYYLGARDFIKTHLADECQTDHKPILPIWKKVKYAYKEWSHPIETASPHCQKVERKEHGFTIIRFKKYASNN